MGLDIALGVIVLLAAVRGWLRGFLLQVIPVVALVGSLYAAEPLGRLVRPSAHEYFPGIRPELLDRLLWWSAAVLGFVVTTGVATAVVRLYRKRPAAEFETRYTDQGAGFLLGAIKGGLVAAFLTAGMVEYVPAYVKSGGWVARQVESSHAVRLNARYRPAQQVWASPPVRALVAQVRSRGLWPVPESAGKAADDGATVAKESARSKVDTATVAEEVVPIIAEPVKAAFRTPELTLPPRVQPAPAVDPRSSEFLQEFDEAIRRELPNATADRR